MPIGEIILATNINKTIPDYLKSAKWSPRESHATLASAMDVGNPSNMERMRHLMPEHGDLTSAVSAYSVSDEEIKKNIKEVWATWNYLICPHTATAFHVYSHMTEQKKRKTWVLAATAHPAKFETIVEPLLGEKVPVPESLKDLLDRPVHRVDIKPELSELDKVLG